MSNNMNVLDIIYDEFKQYIVSTGNTQDSHMDSHSNSSILTLDFQNYKNSNLIEHFETNKNYLSIVKKHDKLTHIYWMGKKNVSEDTKLFNECMLDKLIYSHFPRDIEIKKTSKKSSRKKQKLSNEKKTSKKSSRKKQPINQVAKPNKYKSIYFFELVPDFNANRIFQILEHIITNCKQSNIFPDDGHYIVISNILKTSNIGIFIHTDLICKTEINNFDKIENNFQNFTNEYEYVYSH